MEAILPGRTAWETQQYQRDHGRHAAAAQAFIRLGLILEYDEDSPPPMFISVTASGGHVTETLWGCIALPSAGTEAGRAAVDAWATRHHADTGEEDGRYQAVMHLGGGYRYGVFYTPGMTLDAPAAREDTARPPAMAA